VIQHSAYGVDPWSLHEHDLDLSLLAQSESVFALSNGHIGLRGNLDEGEPHGLPGTYLNSVSELRTMMHGETGFGYPAHCETIINVTNGKLIRLFVDDEPFDVRYGTLHRHERVLDFRAGTLTRVVEWTSPAGKSVRVTSVRMVSLTQRSVAAIRYDVETIDGPLRVVVQSELVTNEAMPASRADPRVAAALAAPLVNEEHGTHDLRFVTVHHTRESQLLVGAGMDHRVDGPPETLHDGESFPDVGRLTIAARLEAGQRLRVDKLLAYGWSSRRSRSAVQDQVVAALAGALLTGWDGLVAEQRARLDEFWAGADVEVDGDPEVQQAVRFALFSVFQASARAEQRPIAAKGLTGPGYEGHTFWDTETFVLPVLTFTQPAATADALRWRLQIMPDAVENARGLGLAGAAFPWRTIRGRECSGYWPAGTAAFHINADIADAAIRYVDVTGDLQFERDVALPILVETARLWRGLGHHDADGRFRIDGVTGPDEYDAVVDNNIYTNLMAAQNLRVAADVANRYPDQCEALNVNPEEAAAWRHAADAMLIPYDERLGVHPQSELYTEHARWDFKQTSPDQYPLLLHFPYFDLYRKQVVKQADLVLAMYLRHEAFTLEEKQRNFAYYEQLTVRDSSLSSGPQAVIAAETGHVELAYDYIAETALVDLRDLNNNTEDGLHLASLASTWTALVAGLGGMRAGNGKLSFAPRLPEDLVSFAFRVCYRGSRISVRVEHGRATYALLDGDPVTVHHYGEPITLDGDATQVAIPAPGPSGPRPRQPHGREPIGRDATHHPVVEAHTV
jgi:alpha,alpha-trehalose phosphorylase